MRRVLPNNPRYPHHIVITRLEVKDSPFDYDDADETEESDEESSEEEEQDEYTTINDDGDKVIVLYDGVGRAFTDTTTTGGTDIETNRRKCSIPVRYDRWLMEVLDGDRITVTVGNIEYSGEIKDVEPDNERTLVYWERPRVND